MQQHLIFGAGLIGGYLAGVLRGQGYPVALVVRPSLRGRFENGLTLSAMAVPEQRVAGFELLDADAPAVVRPVDVLWLTVKCTGVAEALPALRPYVGGNTVIVCCQNGLGSEVAVQQAFPANPVYPAMVQFNVASPAADHLYRSTEGGLALPSTPDFEALAQVLNGPLMPVQTHPDMEAVVWAKLQLNLANAVNALADVPTKTMLEQRAYRRVLARLMDELLAVAKAKGIRLPKLTALPPAWLPRFLSLPDGLFRRVGSRMLAIDPSARASMWWDLSQGKPTEIAQLNGAVVAEGEALGIPTPANQAIVALVKRAECGELALGLTGEALWAALTHHPKGVAA